MSDRHEKSLTEDQDFQEEDVWGVVKEREEESNKEVSKPYKIKKRSSSCVWTSHDGARMIPRFNEGKQQQSSAPMGIPDWSKIYRERSKGSCDRRCYEDDHVDDDDGVMVPPHEYIARRLITTSSMCEGVRTTLKGRDLSKLRDAILTKTGFL